MNIEDLSHDKETAQNEVQGILIRLSSKYPGVMFDLDVSYKTLRSCDGFKIISAYIVDITATL